MRAIMIFLAMLLACLTVSAHAAGDWPSKPRSLA